MPSTVLWVYIVLLLVGGLIGYFKGKSQVSLVMSAAFAAVLVLCAVPNIFEAGFRKNLANILMAALLYYSGSGLAVMESQHFSNMFEKGGAISCWEPLY